MGVAAALLLIGNLLDAIFTIGWIQLGAATEANPLMAGPMGASPIVFMISKLLLVSLGVALLWRLQKHRTAVFAMFGGASVYACLVVYHVSSVNQVRTYLAMQ